MWTLTVLILTKLFILAKSQIEYTLNFDSPIYVCPDKVSQAFVDSSGVEVKRHNETTAVMTGAIRFLKGFEQDTMIEMIVEKDVGGSFEMMASHEICDVCKELSDPNSLYIAYMMYFGFPHDCPFQPGNYSINDLVADTNNVPINSATAGRYQVTVNMFTNGDGQCTVDKVFLACLKLDFIVEPV